MFFRVLFIFLYLRKRNFREKIVEKVISDFFLEKESNINMVDYSITFVTSICNKRIIEEGTFRIVRSYALSTITIIVKVFANKM